MLWHLRDIYLSEPETVLTSLLGRSQSSVVTSLTGAVAHPPQELPAHL